MHIADYLQTFIDIPSTTGNEQSLAQMLADDLQQKGMHVRRMPVQENRNNLFASTGENPVIVLTTHLDTVPPTIKSERRKGRIYGRGACDAKGQIVAMIYALESLPADLKSNVGLLFLVGEETDSIGAKVVIESGFKTEYFINGEPTENICARGQKGVFIFRLKAQGKAAHSGYPEAGDSAISKLLHQLNLLEKLNWGADLFFGEATFNIGTIAGGDAANVVAPSAEAVCTVRLVRPCEEAISLLNRHLLPEIEFESITESDPLHLFVPQGFDSTVVKFGSDAAYLSKIAKTMMVGPGSILNAHKPDEHIEISELEEAVNLYQQIIMKILS